MENFKYKVTVIVPIYNSGEYLISCLNSLILQTIDMKEVEVLLLDDGSTDNSLNVCYQYASKYPFFKVFTHENKGVSATRNWGIRLAQGKYIMYLDSDDELTENTLQLVTDFFDNNFDLVDIVTYPERTYLSTGEKKNPHIRYKTLKKTGIYDATKDFYLYQVRLNIAVKNLGERNFFFDEEMGYHEDQKYCNEIIEEKLKLGFVEGCEYKYKLRPGNITGENTNPIYLFEPTTKYWESLFAKYEDVPRYYQVLFLHDLSWKLSQNYLLPYHYKGEKFEESCNRLWRLLKKVDDRAILEQPSTDYFHRFFFLEKKNEGTTPIVDDGIFSLYSDGIKVFQKDSFELVMNKCKVKDGKMMMLLTLKSQFFNFHEKPTVFAVENEEIKKEMELSLSSRSYYRCKTITNHFYVFYYECELEDVQKLKFVVDVDGFEYPTHYYMMPTCPFVTVGSIVREDYQIKYINKEFEINRITNDEIDELLEKNNQYINGVNPQAFRIRKVSERFADKRIWLYYDCKGVEYDNGYLQFIHDYEKEDGVERYYILNNDFESSSYLFSEKQLKNVIMFGSLMHQELFIRAEKIITAFIEEVNLYPFHAENKKFYMDLMNSEIIYLQHGILHATLPWKYTPERLEVDRVVASSYFELKNFTSKYGFRKKDVLSCGMPRFEKMDRNKKPINRILYAPSWRMYLIGECIDTIWQLTEEKFLNSKYFRDTQEFILSEELISSLEKNDIYLDFKIHPIFRPYLKYYKVNSDRIVLADNQVEDEDYSLFITDFSSYVFNFAYLKRPILYYVPDMEEFEAGLNQYRELDMPLDEGFGENPKTVEELVELTVDYINSDFKIKEEYWNKMDNFFIPIDNCCEKIYNSISD